MWLDGDGREHRFHHVSTDEVYGSLGEIGLFTEETPYAPNSPYSASKAGAISLTQSMAFSLGPHGINVNAVAPGIILTEPVKKQVGGHEEAYTSTIPLRRLGTPEDVADEVRLRLETIGAGGGYIMTPSHMINADIPWENIVAFFDAVEEFGYY